MFHANGQTDMIKLVVPYRNFEKAPKIGSGPGSSVSIATELWVGRSGDRIPVRARFSAPVQTGPGAHPASYTMGTGSFPGVKSGPGRDTDPSPPSSAVVKKE